MANTAAHLVDRVLPDVPVRQYVLSLPFELRALAAFKPEVLRAMASLGRWLVARALVGGRAAGEAARGDRENRGRSSKPERPRGEALHGAGIVAHGPAAAS